MNRSEIEVKLIELSMATKSKKEDAAKSAASVKENIRMEKERLQNKVNELTAIRDKAIKNIRENFDLAIEQEKREHNEEIERLNNALDFHRTAYNQAENVYLIQKKELLSHLAEAEKEEQVKPIIKFKNYDYTESK